MKKGYSLASDKSYSVAVKLLPFPIKTVPLASLLVAILSSELFSVMILDGGNISVSSGIRSNRVALLSIKNLS
jgi:hypothetical protein